MKFQNSNMPPASPTLALHEPFLRRASEHPDENGRVFGMAAFLLARLVDSFAHNNGHQHRELLWYQISATRKYIDDLHLNTLYLDHLKQLAFIAGHAFVQCEHRLLFSPLLALAHQLENDLSIEEALDVVETAQQLTDGRDAADEVAAFLHQGRLLRLAGRYTEASTAYGRGGEMAERLGDTHSVLLSRVGRGIVARFVGNLPESERLLRAVMADARDLGDRDAEGRACHDLADTLYYAGRTHESVPLAFRAFRLYETEAQQAWALCDTGTYLMGIGCLIAARNAFKLASKHHQLPPTDRAAMELEILRLHSHLGDRVSFEYSRRSLNQQHGQMPPEQRLDLEIKLGVGYSHFGEFENGEKHLHAALVIAEEYGINERIFYVENQLREVRERRACQPIQDNMQISGFPSVQETADQLERLVATSSAPDT